MTQPIFDVQPLSDLLATAGTISADLLPPHCQQPIHTIAQQLPPVRNFGFERHLTKDHSDFALRIAKADVTAHMREQFLMLDQQTGTTAWSHILTMLDSPHINHVWIEFDIAADGPTLPTPSVFAGLVDTPLKGNQHATPQSLLKIVQLMGAGRVSAETLATLDRIYAALPPTAQLFETGLMLSRPQAGMRVLIANISPSQIGRLLTEIGWAGDARAFVAEARQWQPLCEKGLLAIDLIGDSIGERVGLELMFHQANPVPHEARWKQVFDQLVARDLCTAAEREAILAWPCILRAEDLGEQWPQHLGRLDGLLGQSTETIIMQLINHIKLDFVASSVTRAKLYYALQVRHMLGDTLY